jgi:Spy/CpxP family protein refolding chaperone
MKKFFGFLLLLGLSLGANIVLFAQTGQNPPPPPKDGQKRMGRPGEGPDGPGGRGGRGGMMRERRGGGGREMGGGPRGGMRGGFGISDEELAKLNLTNDQKIKLYDFRMKMINERESMRKNVQPPAQPQQPQINPEEMRQLMSAKQLGTLTAEQKAKLDSIENNRKQMMDKRKAEMEARQKKMEATHQEFLNIFTLDQRKQLETLRAERAKQMQERMQQRRQKRPNGPQGSPNGPMKQGKKPANQPK